MIYVGGRIAPKYKFRTAGLLMIVWIITIGAIFSQGATSGAYSEWEWVEFAAAIVLGISGALTALYVIYLHVGQDWHQ